MPGGPKEEECREKAQAVLRTFGRPLTRAALLKNDEVMAEVIACEEHLIEHGSAALAKLRADS